jgi:hypothetical protein
MKCLIGRQCGRWTVIEDGNVEIIGKWQIRFVIAKCSCGTIRRVRWSTLIDGKNGSKSCGCLKREIQKARHKPLSERFWDAVEVGPRNDCWEWRNYRNALGYGVIGVGGKPKLAHRIAWELSNSKAVPNGALVCHKCDNPACCNPSHLWLGSNNENMQDMVSKGRSRSLRGAENPNSKLSANDVLSIRTRYTAGGISQQALADEYGVSQRAISLVVRRETYRE